MEFGSNVLLGGASLGDIEDIYVDDVQDGIASMADEMAQAWMQEYKELQQIEKNDETDESTAAVKTRKIFLESLIDLCNIVTNSKAGAKRGGTQHGPMGSRTRLQPRSANANYYDALTKEATARDLALAQSVVKIKAFTKALIKLKKDEDAKAHLTTDSDSFAALIQKEMITKFGTKIESEHLSNDDDDEVQKIIVKIGSQFVLAGFGGDDVPTSIFPSMIGRCKHSGIMVGMDQKDSYVGDEAQSKRGVLTLKYPIENGVIKNWDDFEKLLYHTFYNELRIAPEEHTVMLLTQPTTTEQLAKMMQILFETFNVPEVQFCTESTTSMFASGRNNGINVDFGDSQVRISVVVAGAIVDGSIVNCDFGGKDITDYQMKILTERGYSFTTTSERDIVRDIKETMGFVTNNLSESLTKKDEFVKSYELPDGQCVIVDQERFRINEVWFSPNLIGKDKCLSIQKAIVVALSRVPPSMRQMLLSNIVLSGGPANIPQMKTRTSNELIHILPASLKSAVKIHVAAHANIQSWIGGSILSDLKGLDFGNITRADYNEFGPDSCVEWITNYLFSVQKENVATDPESTETKGEEKQEIEKEIKEEVIKEQAKQVEITKQDKNKHSEIKDSEIKDSEIKDSEIKDSEIKDSEIKDSEIAASKPLANVNTFLVKSSKLVSKSINSIQSMDMLPVKCCYCPGLFSTKSTFTVAKNNWSCNFCGSIQKQLDIPSVPKSSEGVQQEFDFIPSIGETKVSEESKNSSTLVSPSVNSGSRLVVFCVDTSGSMGATTEMNPGIELYTGWKKKKTIKHVSRLNFVIAAVRSKILSLARTDPNAIPVIVTFGSTVRIHLPDGTTHVVEGKKTMESINTLMSIGARVVKRFKGVNGMRSSVKALLENLHKVVVGGCTALGPSLATAVGMCSQGLGGQIILCTDGLANIGVGSLDSNGEDPNGIYKKIALAAKAKASSISILTIDGCKAGLSSLGTAADLTNGHVTVVDPLDLTSTFSGLASESIVASKVELTILVGNGAAITSTNATNDFACFTKVDVGNVVSSGSEISFLLSLNNVKFSTCLKTEKGTDQKYNEDNDDSIPENFLCPISLELMRDPVIMSDGFSYEREEAQKWLGRNTTSPLTNKMLSNTQLLSNITLRHSIEEWISQNSLKNKQSMMKNDDGGEEGDDDKNATSLIPLQVQINYMDSENVPHLRLFTLSLAVSSSRNRAELNVNAKVCAIASIHKAASLAQIGKYDAARIELISMQRLLQRSMTIKSQKKYMAFIVLAEKLDNFMREAKIQEKLLKKRSQTKDDDAASSMYQMKALTSENFNLTVANLVA